MDTNDLSLERVDEMRSFIDVCQDYNQLVFEEMVRVTSFSSQSEASPTILHETMLVGTQSHPIFDDLKDAIETMRAYMESTGGDYSIGFEDGMQRAAGIIETLLKRHKEK